MRIALVRTYQRMLADNLAHPLGIMALDAYLREHGYDDNHLFDMRVRKETPAQLVDRLLPLRPDVVGLSALTIELDTVHELTALLRARAPNVKIVVGGPYATSSKRTIMRDPRIDAVVIGEGEVTLVELLDTMRAGGDLSRVRGILYRKDGVVHETVERPYLPDLDVLPLPSWDRVDMSEYERCDPQDRLAHRKWAAFYTSRGCPFKCTYCHDVFGKRFRSRSPARVIEEMALLVEKYGTREFHFFDDIFNFDRRRVVAICNEIVRRGWKIWLQFPNGLRADMLDLDTLTAMKAAGTFRVSYAIESASQRIQKQVKKNLKLERVRKLVEDTDRLGILVHGFFMLGFPGETREEVLSTVDWAVSSRLHSAGFFLVSPFEGSPLANEYVDPAAHLPGEAWAYYDNPHSLSEVPAEEIKRIQKIAYLRFYGNPWRIARAFQLVPDRKALLKIAWLYARVLSSGIKWHGADAKSFDHRPARVDASDAPLTIVQDPSPEPALQPERPVKLRRAAAAS